MEILTFQEFMRLDIRIGLVKTVEDHPHADKLYVMKVDFGTEERQLVAGLRPLYTREELEGRKIVVVMNLAPAKLRGVESNGMLLAAEDAGAVSILTVDKDVRPGSKVK